MEPPPPPPPPHGANPGTKGSGLPPGNYDIFIIPPHSSGSGFLYLPSLQTHRNSFLAGVGCTLLAVVIWSIVFPVLREWFATIVASGGMAVVVLLIGVGVAGWAWGKTQTETGGPSAGGADGTGMPNSNRQSRAHANGFPTGSSMPQDSSQPPPQPQPQSPPRPPPRAAPQAAPQQPPQPPPSPPPPTYPQSPPQPAPQPTPQAAPQPPPQADPEPPPQTTRPSQPPPPPQAAPAQPSAPPPQTDPRANAQSNPRPQPKSNPQPRAQQPAEPSPGPESRAPPKPSWQRAVPGPEARAPPKPSWQQATTANPVDGSGKADSGTAKSSWEKAREETRKKEEGRKRMEDIRKRADELRKKREDEEKERAKQRERDAREREIREARERREKERELREKARAQANISKNENGGSALPNARKPGDPRPPSPSIRKPENPRPASPIRKHQPPTAKTVTEPDTHSFRPYDKPKKAAPTATTASSSIYSESSYAPSFSTSRTTPPPSKREAYHSEDPNKIVLKAVYTFNHAFTKTPVAQLVSGVGSVTDGLILRITTEGLFIDDDVRGVPQREWDIKAWTLKLVEVWCPHLHVSGASSGSSAPGPSRSSGFFGWKSSGGGNKIISAEESDAFLSRFIAVCKPRGMGVTAQAENPSNTSKSLQTGESQQLHVLRASIRDQEGKRYVFVLQQEEGWKVAVGLQRLRRGTQVRALGLSGMPPSETKGILENMGWG